MMITLMYIQRNIAHYCGGYQGLLLTNQGMRYYVRPQAELYIHHSEGHLPTLFLTVMDQLVKEKNLVCLCARPIRVLQSMLMT